MPLAEQQVSYLCGAVASVLMLYLAVYWGLHISDTAGLDHAASAWMGLAYWATDGYFYPAAFKDGVFGGTRLAPLPILIQGGVFRLVGSPILAAKLLQIGGALALLGTVYMFLRKQQAGMAIALFFSVLFISTEAGWQNVTSARQDLFPVAIQLAAVWCLWKQPYGEKRSVYVSAALCALAVFFKLSAVWAAIGLSLWLLANRRYDHLVRHTVVGLGTGFILFLFVQVLSEGRFLENIAGFLFAGAGSGAGSGLGGGEAETVVHSLMTAVRRFGRILLFDATGAVPLLVLVTVIIGSNVRAVFDCPVRVCFCTACAVIIPTFADDGIYGNHLLDIIVLGSIVTALWISERAGRAQTQTGTVLAAGLGVLSLVFVALSPLHRTNVAEALALMTGEGANQNDPDLILREVRRTDTVLSVLPHVKILLGQDPSILDPYMLKRILEGDPVLKAAFLRPILDRKYDVIVTQFALEDYAKAGSPTSLHWTDDVAVTILDNYRFHGRYAGVRLYKRKLSFPPNKTIDTE